MRRRALLAGVLLAGLVGPLGAAPAQAAAATPTQVVAKVRAAIETSRAKARGGVRIVQEFSWATQTMRYDGTRNRFASRSTDGSTARYTKLLAYYRTTSAAETGIKTLAGGDRLTWIRYSRSEEGWSGPKTLLRMQFDDLLPLSTLVDATAAAGPNGTTVYRITSASGSSRVTFRFTVSRGGLVLRRAVASEGFANVTFTYRPQTVKVPTDVIPIATYRRAATAYQLPARLKAGADRIALEANAFVPSTVALVRERAALWRDAWNASHSAARQVTLTDVTDGVRLSLVQPFSGRTLVREVVLVDGVAVAR